MLTTKRLLAGVMLALLTGAPAAMAGKADDTLRVTLRDAIPNIDPYYNTQGAGQIMAIHIWDTLVHRDPDTSKVGPGLAAEWNNVDDTTIEFKLRDNVTFHNGDKFSADDVVYTINTIAQDKKLATPGNYSYLDSAEKVDDLTVRIKLKRPFPAAIEFLAAVTPIWPKAYREAVGPEEFAKKPVGTGPYKVILVDGAGEIQLERFDEHFEGSPKGKAGIKNLIFRAVADPTTQMAELIGGKADWIEDINADQMENLSKMPTVQTLRSEVQRIAYLAFNAAGRDNPDSPIKNLKVRQAIHHAIDRESMAKQFMPGGSRVLNVICYDHQFGCDQSKAVAYEYNPEKAKQLLEESGLTNIQTEVSSYLHPSWGAAVQNYLQAVGIDAKLNQMQVSASIAAFQQGKLPLAIGRWSGYGIGDVAPYLQYFYTASSLDQVRDPEVQALVEKGGSTNDAAVRKEAYEQAFRLISERAYHLPLFTYVKNYGFSKDLNFTSHSDDWPRFYLSTWK